jgi:hypothetical protein
MLNSLIKFVAPHPDLIGTEVSNQIPWSPLFAASGVLIFEPDWAGVLVNAYPPLHRGTSRRHPSGTFKPFRMEIDHYSEEWDNAPMPYSIFFTQEGHAIHGTNHSSLGRPASHGCVRLSVKNAATLWALVKREKMANTKVVLSGAIPGAGPPTVAHSRPMPLNPDDPLYREPTPQRAYDDRPSLPVPFFLFRR